MSDILFNQGLVDPPSGNFYIALGKPGEGTINITYQAYLQVLRTALEAALEVLPIEAIVEIGPWNMTSQSSRLITYEPPEDAEIVGVQAIIRDNNGDYFPLDFPDGTAQGSAHWLPQGSVRLNRLIGGFFDDALFTGTAFNRGFIYIQYKNNFD
jgi:hypothetical protein